MADVSVSVVVDEPAALGEGPIWADDALLWVDIEGKAVFRYDPRTGDNPAWFLEEKPGTVVPTEDPDRVAVAVESGFGLLDLSEGVFHQEATCEAEATDLRFNDGKVSPLGDLWCGSLGTRNGQPAGAFYRWRRGARPEKLFDGVACSNGLAWDADRNRFYYIDTPTGRVDVFDYHAATGAIANRRPFVEIGPDGGGPDGMTLDADGHLWVAFWGGGCVRRFSAEDGSLLQQIDLPAKRVTACAFGGGDLRDLYITTARVGGDDASAETEPRAGCLFVCRPGVAGRPADRLRL
ncbi:MAG: SMP-30/gluconolactonase/LRE family protein [Opitutales bacterium]